MKDLKTQLILLLCLFSQLLFSQNNRGRSILTTAEIQTDPPTVVVSWPQDRVGDVFILKNKTEPFFQLPSGTTSFTDTEVGWGMD